MRSQPEEPLPPALIKGVLEFNRQEFFRCHETLEELWREQEGQERLFTQGLIQIAVGFHHLLRGNTRGARSLLMRGREKLEPFQPQHRRLNTAGLIEVVDENLKRLEQASVSEPLIPLITTTPAL